MHFAHKIRTSQRRGFRSAAQGCRTPGRFAPLGGFLAACELFRIVHRCIYRLIMRIVLLEPEIAPNVGNVARLCAATNTELHLIEPFGFKLNDTQLKRAGMDYWELVRWHRWANWRSFELARPPEARTWFVESGGPLLYTEARFTPADYLVFGRETAGIPRPLLEANRDHWLRIPMFNPQARSLNLSNCVALVLFEALRQQQFRGEVSPGDGRGILG